MIEVPACVICDGPIRRLKRAMVAPFLAKRIWNRKPFRIDLVLCSRCAFAFYNPRLDDDELQRFYTGYRSPEYLEMRRSFEPWYTEKFNADLASPAHYESRRAKLAPIFQQHLRGRTIRRVLDHGGDHGDLISVSSVTPNFTCTTFQVPLPPSASPLSPIQHPANPI